MKSFRVDPWLLTSILALVAVGVVLIFSSSAPLAEAKGYPPSYFVVSHLKKLAIGMVFLFFGARVDHSFWLRIARPVFFAGAGILVFMMVSGAGITINGAKRWISVAGFEFQPSEIMKLGLFFLLAAKLAEAGEEVSDFKVGFLRPLMLAVAIFVLVLLQPNYSMAAGMLAVSVVMMFVAGTRLRHLLLLVLAGVPAVGVLALTSSYRLKRVLAFLDPGANEVSSYQQLQSLISLGNGGIWGTGLGQGTQKLGYLPMPFTDTIYAILGEELGLVGTTLVMSLFALVFWRGLVIAKENQSRFGTLLATAITMALAVNVFLHVGVCTRLLPATGQPLPLVSFGGSNLVVNLFAMGILLNLSNPEAGTTIQEAPLRGGYNA